jgi:tetratricopeptide (TPR) repeat protein
MLHRRCYQLLERDEADQLHTLLNDRVIQETLVPAQASLRAAQSACPLLAHVQLGLAELAVLDAMPWNDAAHVASALRLAPKIPSVLFQAGLLDIQAGRLERGLLTWRQCLELTGKYDQSIVAVGQELVDVETFFDKTMPAAPELLVRIGRQQRDSPNGTDTRKRIAGRARNALALHPLPSPRLEYVKAAIAELEGDLPTAIDHLQSAIGQHDDLAWRIELARLFAANGQMERAREQAEICLRADPTNTRYRNILRSLGG